MYTANPPFINRQLSSVEWSVNSLEIVPTSSRINYPPSHWRKYLHDVFIIYLWYISGKDQGTPQIKEGIQTLGVEPDPATEESEGSDWTPFEWWGGQWPPPWPQLPLSRTFLQLGIKHLLIALFLVKVNVLMFKHKRAPKGLFFCGINRRNEVGI